MNKKHVLIGGGSGFIGSRLCKILSDSSYVVTIVSRMPGLDRITWHDLEQKGLPKGTTSVVNLAGQNVLDPTRRWTPGFKQNVWNSRVNSTTSMVRAIEKSKGVESFVSISGVSLYKPTTRDSVRDNDSTVNHIKKNNKNYSEEDTGEDFDFMSKLCIEWEKASKLPQGTDCRQINIRCGVVIGRGGGMIQSISLPFWLGFGGPLGSGKQPLPWIHIDDLCHLIQHCLENKQVGGVLNGVAPDIVTNLEFSKAYASALRRPCFVPVPEFAVNLIFGKERASLLLTGAKINPKRTLESGYKFKYSTAKMACDEVTKN